MNQPEFPSLRDFIIPDDEVFGLNFHYLFYYANFCYNRNVVYIFTK